ncbi:hypothetical protein CC85DRAFT_288764 [Cutaneotrichosporon oleaginosum]|uniref:Uncharacterized protein n=1 Tax=Cutaneotrichosporon oleaginosum TaxID=879819 RepID=A0A0J0XDR2_9TREE|nr:uncharacterized protein CC85DRAFT_288764 [Cutaneotrichosporon oleaginosum]KLT39207.1 hypothetical protein CC85DRAFT_288764 [Cutaneotrichosporon oleaginosum]TXT05700.1 hypothetical protein COLE_07020 [Cutaneotrichosporon oleaginosum]
MLSSPPSPPPPPLSSSSYITPTSSPSTDVARRLSRRAKRLRPQAEGQIIADHLTSAFSDTSVFAALAQRGSPLPPSLAAAHEERIAAVGDCTSSAVPIPSFWKIKIARTLTSLLAAHESHRTYLAWIAFGPAVARAVLLDSETIALEADVAFLSTNPRSLPISDLFTKDAPHFPADQPRLISFLATALELLSSPMLPPLHPSAIDIFLSPPRHAVFNPPPLRPRRRMRTPPPYRPPRMNIVELSTPPRSTSPQKRRSPAGGGSPPKRPAIDVNAWRDGKSGAALFDFDPDLCVYERCGSPTELDTPPPSEGAAAAKPQRPSPPPPPKLTFKGNATLRPARSALKAEETVRPGRFGLQANETIRPGTLGLKPAWEGPARASTMLPASQGNDNIAALTSLSLQPAGDISISKMEGLPSTESPEIPPVPIDSDDSNQPSSGCAGLKVEDYLAVLVERKVRVVLVSSIEMDLAVGAIRSAE